MVVLLPLVVVSHHSAREVVLIHGLDHRLVVMVTGELIHEVAIEKTATEQISIVVRNATDRCARCLVRRLARDV